MAGRKSKHFIKCFILFFSIFLLVSDSESTEKSKDILGCWKAKVIDKFGDRNEYLRLISMNADGMPAITLIFETGPRSRVWDYDIPVSYENGNVSWKAHAGTLNAGKDTMRVLKEWKGEKSMWIFARQRKSDEFMQRLASSIGEEYVYEIPEAQTDGWNCAELTDVGIDQEKIVQFMRRVTRGKHNDIHSILIAKNGKLVLEDYFSTSGKRFNPFIKQVFRKKPHHLASTTKAILSTLTGIAIDKGLLSSIDEAIYKFLPTYSASFTQKKRQITVEHLLTMTAGWEWEQFKYRWNDPRNNGAAMWDSDDVIKYVLEKPIVSAPGKKFKYSNGVPVVLGAVFNNICGMETEDFAEQHLFQPLGFGDFVWTSYFDGSLETDGGLALCSRDLAKIGQLFLNNGNWQGNEILSTNWIEESTEPRKKLGGFWGWRYGYYWMQVDLNFDGRKIHSYFVPGDGGQLLSVFPELNMVIVFTAGNYGTDVKSTCYTMIKQYILPALLTDSEKQNK